MNLVCALVLLAMCASARSLSPSAKIKRQYVSPSGPYYARNNNDANAQTLRQVEQKDANGNFNYEYETTNGIKVKQTSYMNGNDRVVVGYYSYPSPDGQIYTVNYIADRNGYRATGTQLGGSGGTLPSIPSSAYPSSTLPPFPSINPTVSPVPPVIPLQPLQPGFVSTTPSPFIIPPAPYAPTQSPYSPGQSIYTPTPTYIPSTTAYPYGPYQSSSSTGSAYPSSSTPLPPFPVYTGNTVPFPGYVYTPQGTSFSPYSNYPTGSGYSTPVTRFNFGTTSSPYTRLTTAYTTPVPNVVLPSSTPLPFVRPYQATYGLANNANAPAILASSPRPFVGTSTTPSPYSSDQDIVYITPSPKVYAQSSLGNRDLQLPYGGANPVDANFYRNNYGYQSVRPLPTSTPLPPTAGGSTITNFAYRNSNAY